MGQSISINTRHGRISGYQAKPHVSPRGAVILVHEIFGVNHHIRAQADRFANYGYVTVAPALFDRVSPGTELGYDEESVAKGRAIAEELGFNGALDGVRGAYDLLEAEHRVAVVGYCWGGSVAFLANTRLGLPAVSYYGGRSVPFLDEPLRAPMLFHFGERDPIIPPEHVALHREHHPGATIHVYPAGHGFNCDPRDDFEPASAALAWQRTTDFLVDALR